MTTTDRDPCRQLWRCRSCGQQRALPTGAWKTADRFPHPHSCGGGRRLLRNWPEPELRSDPIGRPDRATQILPIVASAAASITGSDWPTRTGSVGAALDRPRAIDIGGRIVVGVAEQLFPAAAPREAIGMIDGVPALVTQELQAPLGRAAFDLEHLAQLERLQPRMRQPERNGDERLLRRSEPLVAEVARGPEGNAARRQLLVQLRDARLELRACEAHAKIAHAHGQKLFIAGAGPRRLGRRRRRCRRIHHGSLP